MLKNMDLNEVFNSIKKDLADSNIELADLKNISYGIQFRLKSSNNLSLPVLRIFKGKKGIKFDYSQIKDEAVQNFLKKRMAKLFNNPELDDTELKTENIAGQVNIDLIGADESGKGDYFGPLVASAVFVSFNRFDELISLGVKDSKKISEKKIFEISDKIEEKYDFNVKILTPEKYNKTYERLKNLNTLLGELHYENIKELKNRVSCKNILVDKFANEKVLQGYFKKLEQKIILEQYTKAESNPAVAAASIIARKYFLLTIDALSNDFKIELPLGASERVKKTKKKFLEKYNISELGMVAKLHFKI